MEYFSTQLFGIFGEQRIAVKNIDTDEMYFVDCEHIVVATGSSCLHLMICPEFTLRPLFKNDEC